jgi:hypothetical protein
MLALFPLCLFRVILLFIHAQFSDDLSGARAIRPCGGRPSLTAGRSDSEVGAGADERQGSDAGACQEPPSGTCRKTTRKNEWHIQDRIMSYHQEYTDTQARKENIVNLAA